MKKLLSIITLLHVSLLCYSQLRVTANDGFEGTPTIGMPPGGWNNCNDHVSTSDTQPGVFHVKNARASEGQNFADLITRSVWLPGSVETIWADLLNKFEKDHCYSLNIDLSLSHEFYGTYDDVDYYFDNPCVLQLFGFNGECYPAPERELLWESPVLDNYLWKTFSIQLRPVTGTFEKIALRVNFTSESNIQNSAVFIDRLRFAEAQNIFSVYGGALGIPAGATGIRWYYNETLVPGATDTIMPLMGTGNYFATFFDPYGCFVVTEMRHVEFNEMFSILPNFTFDAVTLNCLSPGDKNVAVYLYDASGRLAWKQALNLVHGRNEFPVSLGNFSPGYYYFTFYSGNSKTQTEKCVLLNKE